MSLDTLFMSGAGRIGRGTWWLGSIILTVANVALTYLLFLVFKWGMVFFLPGRLLAFALAVVTLLAACQLARKRFQDRDRPAILAQLVAGFWAVKALLDLFRITGDPFVPTMLDHAFWIGAIAIGLWYFIELGCLRGTEGSNRHGEDPLAQAA